MALHTGVQSSVLVQKKNHAETSFLVHHWVPTLRNQKKNDMPNTTHITPKTIKFDDIYVTQIHYGDQPVITFALIDQIHQRVDGTARRTFTKNRNYFIDGKDYLKIPVSEIRAHKMMEISLKATRDVVFFTKSGYLKVVKSFRTSQKITKEVCHKYFGDKSILFLGMQSPEDPRFINPSL